MRVLIQIPFVTLPWRSIAYWLIAMLISASFHEYGHACAAINYNVPISRYGVFLMFGVPGAFVGLSTPHLKKLSLVKSLAISGAGAWHNLLLALACWVALSKYRQLISLMYSSNGGILIMDDSSGHFQCNIDVIVSVNHMPANSNVSKFINMIYNVANDDMAFCSNKYKSTTELICCTSKSYHDDKNQFCLWDLASKRALVELDDITAQTHTIIPSHCHILDQDYYQGKSCTANSDCAEFQLCMSPHISPGSGLYQFNVFDRLNLKHRLITIVGSPVSLLQSSKSN